MNAPFLSEVGRGRVASILADCSELTGVPIQLLRSDTRAEPVTQRRYAIMWVAREVHRLSYPRIGAVLGDRDHTTIMAGVRRAEGLREQQPWFARLSDELKARAEARDRSDAEAVQSGFSGRCELYAAQILGPCRAVAIDMGYALVTHDIREEAMDLIAVPWLPNAAAPAAIADAIRLTAASIIGCAFTRATADDLPIVGAHGRALWPIHLGGDVVVNLSVMPRRRRSGEA